MILPVMTAEAPKFADQEKKMILARSECKAYLNILPLQHEGFYFE
jgi:hypothetical protein